MSNKAEVVTNHKHDENETGTDVAKTVMEGSELITLSPKDIAINPQIAGLRSNRTSTYYKARVKELAAALKGDGQDTPVIVRFNTQVDEKQKDLAYELVAGHRRHEAAGLAGVDLICRFQEATDEDALRIAMQENIQREDFSAMDRARFMSKLRAGAFGMPKMGTGEIANYLKISPASVTQSEKLLTLPEEIQQQVEEEKISATAAIELVGAKPEKRAEVAKRAAAKAQAEADKKNKAKEAAAAKKQKAGAKKAKAKAKAKGKPTPASAHAPKSKPVFKKAEPKIETKHIRAAINEVKGAVDKAKAAQRAEIVELAQRFAGKAWPKPIQVFGRELAGHIAGKRKLEHVIAAMDDIADLIQVAMKTQKAQGKGKVKEMPKPKAKAKKHTKPVKVKAKAKHTKAKSAVVAKKQKAA